MKEHVHVNVTQFNNLLREYSVATQKSFRQVVDRTALNVAFEAIKRTEKAARRDIESLPSQPWWPKYIAARLRSGVSFTRRRKGQSTKVNLGGEKWTREDARQASRKIIAARLRAIAFLKSGWLPAIRTLWPMVKDKPPRSGSISGARQFGQPKGEAAIGGTATSPVATIINSAEGITKRGEHALRLALAYVVTDMTNYLARKLGRDAASVASKQKI